MCDDLVSQGINEIYVNTGNLLESEEIKRRITILPGEEVGNLFIFKRLEFLKWSLPSVVMI